MLSRHRFAIPHRRIIIGCFVALVVAGLVGGVSASAKRASSINVAVVPSSPGVNQPYKLRLTGYSGAFRHLFLTVIGQPCSTKLHVTYGFFVRPNHKFDRTIQISNVGPPGKAYACVWLALKPRFARKNTIVFRQRPFTVHP